MINIALILLELPDGRLVFQRRDEKAPIFPNSLALFGGHMKPAENADRAMRRELGEETSLDIAHLDIQPLAEYQLMSPERGGKIVCYHLYRAYVPAADFEVYEGKGAEAYTITEALGRDDLSRSARRALTELGG